MNRTAFPARSSNKMPGSELVHEIGISGSIGHRYYAVYEKKFEFSVAELGVPSSPKYKSVCPPSFTSVSNRFKSTTGLQDRMTSFPCSTEELDISWLRCLHHSRFVRREGSFNNYWPPTLISTSADPPNVAISKLTKMQFGKKISHIETGNNTATAIFDDGTKETANLIVGADGARSVVRKILFGPEKAALQMSPIVGSMCLARLPAETAQVLSETHPRCAVAIHPEGYTLWVGGE